MHACGAQIVDRSPAPAIAVLEQEGAVLAGSRAETGLTMREGVPLPDISTPEAFKQTLLAARSVAFTDPAAGGSLGIYFAGLLERLGIADEIKQKAVLRGGGRAVAEAVATTRRSGSPSSAKSC